MKWFLKALRNYANFDGRARRKEYWYFCLFYFLLMIVALAADQVFFGSWRAQIIQTLTSLIFFIPSLAVLVRRLHDTGRSGKRVLWYYLLVMLYVIVLVTYVVICAVKGTAGQLNSSLPFQIVAGTGALGILIYAGFMLVWCCTKGTPGENEYGPDPLTEELP